MKHLIVIALALLSYIAQADSCPRHCSSCSSPATCSACHNGFYLVNGMECKPCPASCKTCQLGSTGTVDCIECHNGRSAEESHGCLPCIPSCQECWGKPSNCTSCRAGLKLVNSSNGYDCVENKECNKIPRCSNCLNGTSQVCETCEKSYFSFRSGCEKCP